MHYTTLIRHARLHRQTELVDVAIQDGKFAKIAPDLSSATATREIDAEGRLLSPPFIDAHVHLDAVLTVGLRFGVIEVPHAKEGAGKAEDGHIQVGLCDEALS